MNKTRASKVLESSKTCFIPYNFLVNEEMLCEGINPETAKAELDMIIKRGLPAAKAFKGGIQKDVHLYDAALMHELRDHPEIKNLVHHDMETVKSKAIEIGNRLKGKLKPLDIKESLDELRQMFYEEETNEIPRGSRMLSFQAIKSVKWSPGVFGKIRDIFVGFVIVTFVGTLNSIFMLSVSSAVGPELGFILAACLCAPFVEEASKIISLKLSRGSTGSVYVSWIVEFMQYVIKGMAGVLAAGGNPFMMAVMIFLIILGRVYALEMHMTTTGYYAHDRSLYGKVKMGTYFTGVMLHMVWNVTASIISILSGAISFLNTIAGAFITLKLTQSIGALFDAVFGLGSRAPESPQESPNPTRFISPQLA